MAEPEIGELHFIFVLFLNLNLLFPQNQPFCFFLKMHFVYSLCVTLPLSVSLLSFFSFLPHFSITQSEYHFPKTFSCTISFNLFCLGFYINSWTSIYTFSLRKSVFVIPLPYKVFSFPYCFYLYWFCADRTFRYLDQRCANSWGKRKKKSLKIL